jgi:DNA-binding GntR family transcriptional regulator
MTVDSNDPRPPYVQVADGLRAAIKSGELPPGVKLPSGRELAHQWGVALMTLQKAVDLLREEGLVYSQQGRGVFVRPAGAQTHVDELAALRQAVEDMQRRLAAVEHRLRTTDASQS